MDIQPDPELPKGPKKGNKSPQRDIPFDSLDFLASESISNIVHGQGNLEMLGLLASEIEDAEIERHTDGATKPPTDPSLSENAVHLYLSTPERPKLYELQNLLDYLDLLNQSVRQIDDTDLSNKTFKDFLQSGERTDIEKRLDELSSNKKLLQQLEESMETESPYLLEELHSQVSTRLNYEEEQTAWRLGGPESTAEEIAEIRKQLGNTSEIREFAALTTAEKVRATIAALSKTTPTEDLQTHEKIATKICGERDFQLIKAQTLFLEEKLQELQETSGKNAEIVSQNLQADSLLCPELKSRLEGPLSQTQEDALLRPIKFYLTHAKTSTQEDRETQRRWLTIASNQLIEEGRLAKNTNVMAAIRTMKLSKETEKLAEAEKELRTSSLSRFLTRLKLFGKKEKDNTTPEVKKDGKKFGMRSLRGGIFTGAFFLVKQKFHQEAIRIASDNDGRHYGGQEEYVQALKNLGMHDLDHVL
jgi:hypothetical protein